MDDFGSSQPAGFRSDLQQHDLVLRCLMQQQPKDQKVPVRRCPDEWAASMLNAKINSLEAVFCTFHDRLNLKHAGKAGPSCPRQDGRATPG
mmetsp:Transcript_13065/g.28608  ORF Transcript_13065/g.28608 Transcript_13065/m.28608 type:complete len:91 (-) Transcript_13065:213-485(-)